ncbi:hypothetical protein ACF1G0_29065 [Streptomyces sp. NPDC013953]|uniref:hypothetical protein n=1 Tax=Streptomyces sp. NPDC013953 TaxID=3364868 RepID=UPI0036F64248
MITVPRCTTGAGAAPRTYSAHVVCASVFLGSAGLLPLLGATGELHHPAAAFPAYCALAAAASLRASARFAPLSALLCWLFYDGFVVHQQGELTFDGSADVRRLGLLLAAAVLGTAAGWAGRALAARPAAGASLARGAGVRHAGGMSDHAGPPMVVSGVMPGDPPFRMVEVDGEPVGIARDLSDVVRLARQVGLKHVDLDDPAFVRWVGGGKYHWNP